MKGCRGLWLLGGKQSAMAAQWGPGWEGMVTIAKEALHRLIDALPDGDVLTAWQLLAPLHTNGDRGLPRVLAEAPWDDEPETDEERAAVEQAYEDLRQGRVVSVEATKREFGLRIGVLSGPSARSVTYATAIVGLRRESSRQWTV